MNTQNLSLVDPSPESPEGSQEEKIGNHPFFSLISPHHGEIIKKFAILRRYPAQAHIFQTECAAEEFHLIVSGNVVLETPFLPGRGTLLVEELGPGDLLGCSWLFGALHWQYGARTLCDVETICFDAGDLRRAIAEDHELGYELAMCIGTTMLHRLDRTRAELLTSYEHNLH